MSARFDRTTYAREYARKRQAAELAQRNVSASVCQRKNSAYTICGGLLETITDGNGRTALVCRLCERRRRGICRECSRPVDGQVGKAVRCAYHKAQQRPTYSARYRTRHRADYLRRCRQYARTHAEESAVMKRAWRKANRDKVKAQKQRAVARGWSRENQAKRRAAGRCAPTTRASTVRRDAMSTLRTCLTPGCDIVLTGRKKKCTRCKERERREALSILSRARVA